jgi:hypothetical protein
MTDRRWELAIVLLVSSTAFWLVRHFVAQPLQSWSATLADNDFVRTLAELDRLLNDPDVPMQPALIWRLVAEVAGLGRHIGEDPRQVMRERSVPLCPSAR